MLRAVIREELSTVVAGVADSNAHALPSTLTGAARLTAREAPTAGNAVYLEHSFHAYSFLQHCCTHHLSPWLESQNLLSH